MSEVAMPLLFGYLISIFMKNKGQESQSAALPGAELLSGFMMMVLLSTSAYTTTMAFILNQVVADKENKMRETLKIMSMGHAAYALSYVIVQGVFALITTAALYYAIVKSTANPSTMVDDIEE